MQSFKQIQKIWAVNFFLSLHGNRQMFFLKPFLELYAMTCLECSHVLKIKRLPPPLLFLLASRSRGTCLTW